MIPYMPTYSYYNIRNIRNIRSIRSICNICNIYRTLLIAVYLVGVEKLRIGHFYPYRLRYFMHFLLDKGYFMLAYRMIENHTGGNLANNGPRKLGPRKFRTGIGVKYLRSPPHLGSASWIFPVNCVIESIGGFHFEGAIMIGQKGQNDDRLSG